MDNNEKKPSVGAAECIAEVEDILANARNSVQLNMQRSNGPGVSKLYQAGKLDSLIDACRNSTTLGVPSTDTMLQGGLRRGELLVLGGSHLHPAYAGIGAVASHEEAMDKLEAAGKAYPDGYLTYHDNETGRQFSLPALTLGKSTFFQNVVRNNPFLLEIYTRAVAPMLDDSLVLSSKIHFYGKLQDTSGAPQATENSVSQHKHRRGVKVYGAIKNTNKVAVKVSPLLGKMFKKADL